MKLKTAILVLTIHNEHNPDITATDREQANQLGIEALKRVEVRRENLSWKFEPLLPGETPVKPYESTPPPPDSTPFELPLVLSFPKARELLTLMREDTDQEKQPDLRDALTIALLLMNLFQQGDLKYEPLPK